MLVRLPQQTTAKLKSSGTKPNLNKETHRSMQKRPKICKKSAVSCHISGQKNCANKLERPALNTLAAVLFASATLVSFSPDALATNEDYRFNKPKGSLYSTFQSWKHKNYGPTHKKTIIKQASAKPAVKIKKAAKNNRAALKADITDTEILAQNEASDNDPFEPMNRLVFGFNEILDFIVFTPVSKTYRTIVPTPVREGVTNVIANAKAPVTFANDILQGEPERAKTTFVRFLINSTAGFGGFVDAAEAGGLPKHTEDFGQTLAVWGIGSGPYVVLPVLGPSSPRHIVGRVADTAMTPSTWLMADLSWFERSTPTIADLVTGHEAIADDIKTLRETSPDFYASVRNIYRQSRKSAIANGDVNIDGEPLPEIPDE